MKKSIYVFAIGVMTTAFSFAQEDSPVKKDEGKFSVSGYIDSYYNYGFQNSKYNNVSGVAGTARAFDKTSNQFSLGLVQTKFMYSNAKSEMVIDLAFGPNAALGNFGNVPGLAGFINPVASGGTAYGPATYLSSMAIKQAYFAYRATDKLSLTVGQFGTHIGYEVIDAPVNFNYSLSNLFNNGPFYHVGAKLNYAFSDKIGVMVGLVNNWDNLYDYKTQKSGVAQVFLSPIDGWNIYFNWIGGYGDDQFRLPASSIDKSSGYVPVLPAGSLISPLGVGYTRNLFDITTGYQITDQFYVGLNAAYGFYSFDVSSDSIVDPSTGAQTTSETYVKALYKDKTTSPGWYGAAFYANYKINDMFGVGIRAEHFNDDYGVRYIGRTNNSLTLTAPITLADGHLIVKPELRHDVSSAEIYLNNEGGARRDQTTLGIAFIYKY